MLGKSVIDGLGLHDKPNIFAHDGWWICSGGPITESGPSVLDAYNEWAKFIGMIRADFARATA
jgi:hypothetical protein